MIGTWVILGRRLPSHRLAEVALAGVLASAMAVFSSDGTPARDPVVDPIARAAAFLPESPIHFGSVAAAAVRVHVTVRIPPPPVPTAPPATILIPVLNVHRPVEAVGVDHFGTMIVPRNLWNAGWFKYGPVPGAPGDAVIEGHAGYPDAPLLFGKLGHLRLGDQIVVVLADGSRQLFLVRSVKSWPATAHPTGLFDAGSQPRLTLITCSGTFNDQNKTYSGRLVVEAAYAGLG
jgi:hypothetical protein